MTNYLQTNFTFGYRGVYRRDLISVCRIRIKHGGLLQQLRPRLRMKSKCRVGKNRKWGYWASSTTDLWCKTFTSTKIQHYFIEPALMCSSRKTYLYCCISLRSSIGLYNLGIFGDVLCESLYSIGPCGTILVQDRKKKHREMKAVE